MNSNRQRYDSELLGSSFAHNAETAAVPEPRPLDAAIEAAHRAICEDSLEDCLEWRGRCVKAIKAAAPYL